MICLITRGAEGNELGSVLTFDTHRSSIVSILYTPILYTYKRFKKPLAIPDRRERVPRLDSSNDKCSLIL